MASIKIVIERLEDGRIQLLGPIQDKVIMYGLLEAAKDTVQDWHHERAAEAESRITPATEMPTSVVLQFDGVMPKETRP